jgi:hypothetical protein
VEQDVGRRNRAGLTDDREIGRPIAIEIDQQRVAAVMNVRRVGVQRF